MLTKGFEDRLIALFVKCRRDGKKNADIANALGLCYNAFYKRTRHPELFTIGQINDLMNYLEMDAQERAYLLTGATS